MIGRIKYWLFCYLTNDICKKNIGKCHECQMCYELRYYNKVFILARKTWGLEE